MVDYDRRIRIIAGNYGSGKTEFAINYAIALCKINRKVALSDLDIVNVYFRSREKRSYLEKMGIKVISSTILESGCDMPAVSAEIATPIKDKSYDYVIDLGGNDVGTIVLKQVKARLDKNEVDFFMVVNGNRPDTSSVELIIAQMNSLEKSTGLHVTGFINNTNLVRETTKETILKGDRLLLEVSKRTNIPIKYTSYMEEIINDLPENISGELFPLQFFMRESWM